MDVEEAAEKTKEQPVQSMILIPLRNMELSDDEKEEEGTECGKETTEIVHKLKDDLVTEEIDLPSSSSNIAYSVEDDEAGGGGDCAGTNLVLDQSAVMLSDEQEVVVKETIDEEIKIVEKESNDAVELIEINEMEMECNEGQASKVVEKLDKGELININENSNEGNIYIYL